MNREGVLGVTQALQAARALLETRFPSISISGEITGFKLSGPGHMYFSLKDERSVLNCVFFRSSNAGLAFKPEDGLKVVATGSLTLYEARGQFQLNVRGLEPQGLGALQLQYEQLKRRLAREGLFEESAKKPLPRFPRRVALLTSPQGAAIHDFHRLLQDRVSVESVRLFPVKVHGAEAPEEIVSALGEAGSDDSFDVLVLTRGGGSLEDLAAFNDERVVRALAACPHPTISAVGHETDFTLCDLVADRRAATPSAAASLLGPSRDEVRETLADFHARLGYSFTALLRSFRRACEGFRQRLEGRHPGRILGDSRQRLDEILADMIRACRIGLKERGSSLEVLASDLKGHQPGARIRPLRERMGDLSTTLHRLLKGCLRGREGVVEGARIRLEACHPMAPLSRGYALVTRASDGTLLRDAVQAPPGEKVRIRLHRGELDSTITASRPENAKVRPDQRREV